MRTRAVNRDFGWIILAYLCAIGVAFICVAYWPSSLVPAFPSEQYHTLWRALIADVAATLVIFSFSQVFRNASFYDAYWSVTPPLLLAYWWWVHVPDLALLGIRESILGALVLAWSIRLTHNWARGWQGLTHVDWRYVDLKAKTGRWYPAVDLLGIELMPTLLVFLGCYPLWVVASTGPQDWRGSDLVWVILGMAAVWLEYRADNVLREFRQTNSVPGSVLQHDVWAWCRHPNYLGELGFWCTLAVAGAGVNSSGWVWLGFASMVALFVGISIPMIDKRQLENKPGYANYQLNVPSLIPMANKVSWRKRG